VVSEIDKLFSARFDALVNSLQIGKPPAARAARRPAMAAGAGRAICIDAAAAPLARRRQVTPVRWSCAP
jgi:electron transfer flavoprotein alpha/beta subunit